MKVSPLDPTHDAAVRQIFRDTLVRGDPLPFDLSGLNRYERLCLDWYLGPGRAASAVLVDDDTVVGYVLVCVDEAGYRRWARLHGLRWAGQAIVGLLTRRYRGDAARFHRLRLLDGWRSWRARAPALVPMHIHFNIARSVRARGGGLRLVNHVDRLCRDRGLAGWYGELNVPCSAPGLVRTLVYYGGTIVHRRPSATFSWLLGEPVERLTVVRHLDPAKGYRPMPQPRPKTANELAP